jgi:hypothetical protein
MAIIDSLMNLPLLYWASNETGDQKYRDIAVGHANMVLKHFIRPDNSLWHAYRFNPQTGEPIGPENFCGRGVDSYWARGAAWAIYGEEVHCATGQGGGAGVGFPPACQGQPRPRHLGGGGRRVRLSRTGETPWG